MRKIIVASFLIFLVSGFTIVDTDFIGELRKKINSFNQQYKRAKLDIIFNQPKYIPGDTAFFRALYVSAADLKMIPGRQIITLDLYDEKGQLILNNQVLITNGISGSQLAIPNSMKPGIYRLVAYSNWMKNFDSSLFFQQDFIVSGKNEFKKKPTPVDKIVFYPEGGHLIDNIENNLVIKSSLQDSSKQFVIKNDKGEITGTGKINRYGFGDVKITPAKDEHYSLELTQSVGLKRFEIPSSENTGFALQLANDMSGVKITASENINFKSSNYFIAFVNSSGLISSSTLKITENKSTFISIPENIQPGVTNVIVFSSDFKILAERLIFKKPPYLAAQIKQSRKVYGVRDSVIAHVSVVDENNNPLAGHFSVRVINTDLFSYPQPLLEKNILLQSDLSSVNRDEDFEMNDELSINLFLVSQSYNWMKWEAISANKQTFPKYKSREYVEIEGRLISAEGKSVPDSTIISLFLEKQVKGYEVITFNNGSFNIPMVLDPWGADKMFYCTTYRNRDIKNLYLQLAAKDTVYKFKGSGFKESEREDAYSSFMRNRSVIDKSFLFYSSQSAKNLIGKNAAYNPNSILEEEFGGADLEVNLNDFVVFPTMADVVREILPAVEYRKIRGRDVMRLYTTQKKPGNFAGPLFVIDGLLTKEIQNFLELDPQYVSSIKLVKETTKLRRFGSLCENGVIIVRTKYPDIRTKINESHAFEFSGLNRPIKVSPLKAKNKTIPDLRASLYWNSDISLDTQGNGSFTFNTSDDVGNYEIQIEGISSDGKPFFAKSNFATQFIKQ